MDSARQSDNQIGLNVGGKIYLTTRDTLTRYPNSFFAIMLDSDIPSDRDAQGNYLIDRDSEIFRHVLNFMRCGELVLPRGFNEFDLLEREADFFSLEALEVALREAAGMSVAGMSVWIAVGKGTRSTYMMTREALMREKESFFTDMLDGGKPVPRDTQGNYVICRNNSLFHHIADYLVRGGILNDIASSELRQLRKEAKYFRLQMLEQHNQSVESLMQQPSRLHFHFFYSENGPCVAYSNRPLVGDLRARFEKFWKGYKIGIEVCAGEVDPKTMSKFTSASSVKEFFQPRHPTLFKCLN
ncbi:SH3KBP1-binding protein 1-like [Strongylocentrotus purpuratus]|uniref:BTB domain-containing protein n=1 Tax=Strongylocentrotus purpuratus TaxID=7668 RepID=A0A7M7T5S2_STRPU|nr:SH3KBP1-binding protein 1-like [Strongylocentrotus purpuratus]